jgi:hypothetical protein
MLILSQFFSSAFFQQCKHRTYWAVPHKWRLLKLLASCFHTRVKVYFSPPQDVLSKENKLSFRRKKNNDPEKSGNQGSVQVSLVRQRL